MQQHDDGAQPVLEAAPTAQNPSDAFPELPLGVEAFRSPLHTLPASPPVPQPEQHVRVIYFVVCTLAIALGVFAALAMQEPTQELREAKEDLMSSKTELPSAHELTPKRGAVGPVVAATAPIVLGVVPNPPKRLSAQRAPSIAAATPTPTKELSATRRGKRKGLRRSAAGRAGVKPAIRARAERPTRAAVLTAMRKVTPDARSCLSGNTVAQVDIAFSGATGKVEAATVHGVTGAAASCVARAVRAAKLQPFTTPRLEITFPFRSAKSS
ncbi:MAG TPA: hypothetical protein VFN67_08535 [Polyangiales bacterium]|nr:hypothetical protein [Polyangiales bacterium]